VAGRDPNLATPHGLPAWSRVAAIGDYDGAPDKEDVSTETVPYAWSWYRTYETLLGTAFTTERTGVIFARKLALARHEAAKTRTVERAICNSQPVTSDELLGTWAVALRVPFYPEDEKWQVRLRCAARFSAPNGPNFAQVDESLADLLGDIYVQTIRRYGSSLSSPPTQTFWSGNPGSPGMSLGGGEWLSERSRITVEVDYPADAELGAFLRTVNVAMFHHLDITLPAWCTIAWTTWAPGSRGFYLDVSRLDLTGLTDS
jgi:hypothetical protein